MDAGVRGLLYRRGAPHAKYVGPPPQGECHEARVAQARRRASSGPSPRRLRKLSAAAASAFSSVRRLRPHTGVARTGAHWRGCRAQWRARGARRRWRQCARACDCVRAPARGSCAARTHIGARSGSSRHSQRQAKYFVYNNEEVCNGEAAGFGLGRRVIAGRSRHACPSSCLGLQKSIRASVTLDGLLPKSGPGGGGGIEGGGGGVGGEVRVPDRTSTWAAATPLAL